MTGSVKCRCEIEIGRSKSWSRKRNFGRAQMFGFLILVAKHCGKTFGEMLGDKIGGQAGKSSEMVAANSLKKCGRNWAAASKYSCQIAAALKLVCAQLRVVM